MAGETILQHPIAQKFIYPFLLVFFIVFAVLEKTKALGEEKKQINALVSFVIGLIFVSAVSPKMVVQDMILFLTVAIVITFIVLLLWGFISGKEMKAGDNGSIIENKNLRGWVVAVIVIAVIVALLSSLGVSGSGIIGFLFGPGTGTFWTNFLFIAVIAVALSIVLSKAKGGDSGG